MTTYIKISMLVSIAFPIFNCGIAFAADNSRKYDFPTILWSIYFILLSALIGYVVGTMKSFREAKQKAYGELLPPILKMAYNPQTEIDEKEFCEALSKLWIYSSKEVAKKMEGALSILHHPERGDFTEAVQEAVIEMRKDIQLWSCQKLDPRDVNHLYTRISGNR